MIVTRTPLRVSFAGGGSDIPAWYQRGEAGQVLSAAINRYIYVMAGPNFHPDRIRVAYSRTEMVRKLDELDHELVREAIRFAGLESGVEIATVGEVPGRGTGLGSSATVTVGVLHALGHMAGIRVTPDWLAEKASYIEIGVLKRPSGKQDQYAAAFGGLNNIVFHPSGQVDVRPIKVTSKTLRALNRRLLLFYTGQHRKSADILSEQSENLRGNGQAEADMRAMVGLVRQAQDVLEVGQLDDFGAILKEGWERKRRLSDSITTPEIDAYYERALEAGAIGGKLCGAGAGGFLLLYVPEEYQDAVCGAVGLRCMQVEYGVDGSECLFGD